MERGESNFLTDVDQKQKGSTCLFKFYPFHKKRKMISSKVTLENGHGSKAARKRFYCEATSSSPVCLRKEKCANSRYGKGKRPECSGIPSRIRMLTNNFYAGFFKRGIKNECKIIIKLKE